jgi:hypothetical protein
MMTRQLLRSSMVGLFVLAGLCTSVSALQAQSELTTADFYGTYELLLPGVEHGAPGSEMIATWTEEGMTVKQMDNVIIETGIELGSAPGTMAIWDPSDQNPACAAEGLYLFEDDGTTITLTLLSDECDGRAQSADGAQMVRLD